MAKTINSNLGKTNRIRAWYNAFFTVFWSVLCLYPIGLFSYKYLSRAEVFIFAGISFMVMFLPDRWLDFLALSRKRSVYKKLKVDWVNTVSQDGTLVNKASKQADARYRLLKPGRASAVKLIARTYMFEKFHWGMCLYFLMLTYKAVAFGLGWWVAVLLAANIIYNVYPNLLQQYLRLRLRNFVRV